VECLEKCISGTSAVFSCVATNENVPGCSIALDAAHSIIAALCRIRFKDPSAVLPRIVVLSALPVNEKLSQNMSPLVRNMLFLGEGNIYEDLRRAEKYYRLHSTWVSVTFVQPGGLSVDTPKGHVISTEKAAEWLSYADLAAAMIEVADSDGKYDWMGITVLSKGKTRFNSKAPSMLAQGILWSMMPWLYRFLH
jgi:oxidoreductase AflX